MQAKIEKSFDRAREKWILMKSKCFLLIRFILQDARMARILLKYVKGHSPF